MICGAGTGPVGFGVGGSALGALLRVLAAPHCAARTPRPGRMAARPLQAAVGLHHRRLRADGALHRRQTVGRILAEPAAAAAATPFAAVRVLRPAVAVRLPAPSRIDGAKHAAAISKLLVKRLRQNCPQVRIVFRGDSGFCRRRTLNSSTSMRWRRMGPQVKGQSRP